LLLVGCGSKASSGGAAQTVTRSSSEKIDVFNQPEKMTVKIATLNGYTRSDSMTEKYLEDRYNIDIEIVPLPGVSDAPAKISLLMADENERPDIIWWFGMEADFAKWKDAGLLADLTEYVDKYPNMKNYYDAQDSRIMFYATSEGGKIYRIPGDVSEVGCEALWIRKDWLDNLGLPIPKTLAEYEDALYKFTFNDPDGNGKNDTYGFAGDNYDLRSFWPWVQGSGTARGNFYFDFVLMPDGSYAYGPATEDAKLWLGRVAKLYKDGVINPNVILRSPLGEEVARGQIGSFYRWVAYNNPSNNSMRSFYTSHPDGKWIPIDMVAGDNGDPQEDPGKLSAWCFFGITNKCKDPERLYAIWDDMANPEPYVTRRFGFEGEHWQKNPDGTYTLLVASTDTRNQEENIGLVLFRDHFGRKDEWNISNTPETAALFAKVSRESRGAYDLAIEKKDPNSYKAWAEFGSDVTDIRDAYLWSVIAGTESLDNWDKYLADLKRVGLDEVIAELYELYPKQQQEMEAYLSKGK
jgi:putative aldouronate transport system substrate-binding protein